MPNPWFPRRRSTPAPRPVRPSLEALEERFLLDGTPIFNAPGNPFVAEGQSIALTVSASSPDGASLTYSASGLPQGLSLDPATGSISGIISYANVASGGTAQVVTELTASEGSDSGVASMTWTVSDTNRLPDMNGYWSWEGDNIDLSMQGSDNTGTNSLTYSASGLPLGVSFDPNTALASGVVSYRNAANGQYACFNPVFSLSDDHGGTDTRTIHWGVGDVPLLSASSVFASEGTSVAAGAGTSITPTGITYSATGLPQGVTLDPATGLISGVLGYANAPSGGSASLAIALTASDSEGPVETATEEWWIDDTNRLPVVPALANAEGDSVSLSMEGTDNTGTNHLTYSASGLPQGLSIDPNSGLISGVVDFRNASNGQMASFAPMVTLQDDHGGTDTRVLDWSVSDTALLSASTVYGSEGTSVAAKVGASIAPAGITYSATGLPQGLTFDSATGLISGILSYANAPTGGSASLATAVTASDSEGVIETATEEWIIADTNRLPAVFELWNVEGDTVSLSMQGTDNTGTNSLTYSASGLPLGLSIDPNTGLISGVLSYHNAANGQVASFAPTVMLQDDHGGTDTRSIDWSINDVSRTVHIDPIGDQRNNEWDSASLQAHATAPDNAPLIYSAGGLPHGLQIDPASGLIEGLLDDQSAGVQVVTVSAQDADDTESGSVTFTWTVYPPLTATASASPDAVVDPGTPLQFTASAAGGSGSGYSFAWDFGDGSSGTGAMLSHAYDAPDETGDDYTATVTVTDDFGNSAVEAVVVAVDGIPTIEDETVDVSEDPFVLQAEQADQQAAAAAEAAADQLAQQGLLLLEQAPPTSPGTSTLTQDLAADDAADRSAMQSADNQYAQSIGSDDDQFNSTVQTALADFNAAEALAEQQYDTGVDQSNAGYTTTLDTLGQSFLDATAAADTAYQQQAQTHEQTLTTQLQEQQQQLDEQTAADEQDYANQVSTGADHLQQVLQTADQAYADQVEQQNAQRDHLDSAAADAEAAIESLAAATDQDTADQDQAQFDQAAADAETTYQAGADDEAATTVPDFSQDSGVQAAQAAAQSAFDAASQQADAILDQQLQDAQATLQAAYDAATATYNQALADAAAAEAASDAQADQTYDAALSDDQQTRDAAVDQAWAGYGQLSQAAKDAYNATVQQAGQDRQASEQAADDGYLAAIGMAWDAFDQSQLQAQATYAAAEQAARDLYNGTIGQAQSTYDGTASALEQTFQQQKGQAQGAHDLAIGQAQGDRAAAFAAAQSDYDSADQAAQQAASNGRQAAMSQYLTATNTVDQQYADARKSARSSLQNATRAATQAYDLAFKNAAQAYWDFIDNVYLPQRRVAEKKQDQPAIDQLIEQKQEQQKAVALARDAAEVQLAQALGAAQLAAQPALNAAEAIKFNGYANARMAYNNAVSAANVGYDQAMAQPSATLQSAQASAQQAYLNAVADADQAQADANADAESQYDQGLTTAKKTLADALAAADKTLADTVDAAAQVRDVAVADSQEQLDFDLADAEQVWKDAREAAATTQERANATAYVTFVDTVTTAGVALDDAVTTADVAWDEADGAAEVAWVTTVSVAWETRQVAEANALKQWYDVTTAADTTAREAAKVDLQNWNTMDEAAWQVEAGSVLTAFGAAVDGWAQGAGTRYAQLVDTDTAAWINAETGNIAAAVSEQEATFNAGVDADIQQAETDEAALNAVADDVPSTAQVAVAATVAEIEAEAQEAADTVTAEDEAWQADEHAAVQDEAVHDTEEAAEAAADANIDQDAQDTWEHGEAEAARDDQRAVAQADNQGAHADADAVKAGNDAIAAAHLQQATHDALAAQARDQQVATTHQQTVYEEAAALDTTVHTGTSQAQQQVVQGVTSAVPEVAAAAGLQMDQIQARNAALVTQQIADHDAAQTDLLNRQSAAIDARVAAAQQRLDQDEQLPASAFNTVNPPPPQSRTQVVADYMPSNTTILLVGGGIALSLIPGVGQVLLVAGAGVLSYSASSSFFTRVYDGNQNLLEAGVGAAADVTGASTLVAGIWNRDIVTGEHLGLTVSQQRQMITEGSIQFGLTVYGAFQAGRGWFRSRKAVATEPVIEQSPPSSGARPGNPEPTPPAKATQGSNVGEAGAIEQPPAKAATPCFPAGTPIRTPNGSIPIEDIRIGQLVLSKPENSPEVPVVIKVVREVFVRVSPLLNLHVRERIIQVTPEHPFWVEGQGWRAAAFLQIGDILRTSDNRQVPVEGVADAGEVKTVYNFHVGEYRTYFVGHASWGFDIWTHNANGHEAGATPPSGEGTAPNTVPDEIRFPDGRAPEPPNLFEDPLPVHFPRSAAGVQPPNPQARLFGPELPPGEYVYVQAPNGQVVVVPQGSLLHPGVLGNGMPAAGAGELTIGLNGVVAEVNNISGAFRFSGSELPNVIRAIEMQGGKVAPGAARIFQN